MLERNVIEIPITTSSHATSMTSKQTIAFYNLIGCRRCSAVDTAARKAACKCFTASILALPERLRVNVLQLQF